MPTPEILQKLKNYLTTSKSFACLPESEQAGYLARIEQADDEQIVYIMQLMEEEDQKYTESEQQQLEQAKTKLEMAEKLSKEIKETKKVVQKANEEADQSQSADLLVAMEEQLKTDDSSRKNSSPEHKKFLGLF